MGGRKLQVANIYRENIKGLLQNKSNRAGFVQSYPSWTQSRTQSQQTNQAQRNWFTNTLGVSPTATALTNGS